MGGNILIKWVSSVKKKAKRLSELRCNCDDGEIMHGCEWFSAMRELEMKIGDHPVLLLMIIRGWEENENSSNIGHPPVRNKSSRRKKISSARQKDESGRL